MGYRIDLGAWSGIFAVPCDLVDRQLKLADGNKIKVLLYLLRHSGRAVETAELAQLCGISEGDAADAVEYWRQEGLLRCEDCQLGMPPAGNAPARVPEQEAVCASAPLPSAPPPARQEEPTAEPADVPAPEEPAAKPKAKAKERIRYAYNECAEMLGDDSELRHMLSVIEGLLSKNLNHTEIAVFITLVKWYGLPASCVALLVEHCLEIGKPSIAYIETTGIGWINEELNTVELVMEKIARLRAARSAWTHLRLVLDIPERAPTKKEQEYSSVWINEWHMPDELILLAYERCVDKKGKLSTSYMNGILSNWHKNGIITAAQAAAEGNPSGGDGAKPASSGASSGMYETVYDREDIDSILDDDWMGDV